jgi:hypothetical protein
MIDLHSLPREELLDSAAEARSADLESDLSRRALLAFLKSSKDANGNDAHAAGLQHDGKLYVALLTKDVIAAVYRVRNDLQLKRMRRVPQPVAYAAELERRNKDV